jgi:hypothetical protein
MNGPPDLRWTLATLDRSVGSLYDPFATRCRSAPTREDFAVFSDAKTGLRVRV